MSEVGPTYSSTGTVGSGAAAVALATVTSGAALGSMLPVVVLPIGSNVGTVSIAGYLASVPRTAAILYRALIDGDTRINMTRLELRAVSDGQVTVEVRVPGKLSDHAWTSGAVGKILTLQTIAVNSSGEVLAADTLIDVVISDTAWQGSYVQVSAIGSMPERAGQTVAINKLTYLKDRSSGKRTIRIQAQWGIQPGDTLQHVSIDDLIVESLIMTIERTARVMEITEAV
jgi:hypothetical protein